MNETERAALSELQFSWAPTREDVWQPLETHVDGLNDQVARTVMAGFGAARAATNGTSPLGVVIMGQNGAGKTHMLRWVREQVQRADGYFFLMELGYNRDFWQNTLHSLISGLGRESTTGQPQLAGFVHRLADRTGVPNEVTEQILGGSAPKLALDHFITALRHTDRRLGQECQHTARALLMLAAHGLPAQDAGFSFLTSPDEVTDDIRAEWGPQPESKSDQQTVQEISRLLAFTGPCLFAVDQIDTIIDNSDQATDAAAGAPIRVERNVLAEQVGSGLMELREAMQRTVTVVACLPNSWKLIADNALNTVSDRFLPSSQLARIPSAAVGRALVEAHVAPRLARIGFVPPYSTWPVLPDALVDAPRFTPRLLLKRINNHVMSCLADGTLVPLASLDDSLPPPPDQEPTLAEEDQLSALDDRFRALTAAADITAALDHHTEDTAMPVLLAAGLTAWMDEQGADREPYSIAPLTGEKTPALHAKLRKMLNEETEDQITWSFRSVASSHGGALTTRLERARVIGELGHATKRKVYLLKPGTWSAGRVTTSKINAFLAAGGVILPLDPDDLRAFAALLQMRADNNPALPQWLRTRLPASRTALLRAVFGEPGPTVDPVVEPPPPPPDIRWPSADPDAAARHAAAEAAAHTDVETVPSADVDTVPLGTMVDTGSTVDMALEAMRKHTVIFAGSGSGKTVLIRRLVEECALHGVSSIVLDPNNDLARLGEAWPTPPTAWGPGDSAKADDYIANTEVVIWTPRRTSGRPLSFQPLPDFAAVMDDPDELGLALDTAVAALAPRARMDGATAKAERGRAVLREALAYFAERGESGMKAFLDLLADLPEDVTSLTKATAMAADMADTLNAAMINDPLFGGSGTPVDPGVLLTPSPGKRARVSVISLIGLPSDEQRQSFVNQLQMALFAWIKRNPAGDRPLGGLFVMDEAQTLAPSGAMTACTESTLALASQARKYGLGLIFATQAPRGIHNRIVGNAATQFYGFLNSPTQIAVAKELAQAKSSGVLDISRLSAGQFYSVGEGMPFRKLATPLCLSHHPKSALTAEEVLRKAQDGR
jgi:hypothetical protein